MSRCRRQWQLHHLQVDAEPRPDPKRRPSHALTSSGDRRARRTRILSVPAPENATQRPPRLLRKLGCPCAAASSDRDVTAVMSQQKSERCKPSIRVPICPIGSTRKAFASRNTSSSRRRMVWNSGVAVRESSIELEARTCFRQDVAGAPPWTTRAARHPLDLVDWVLRRFCDSREVPSAQVPRTMAVVTESIGKSKSRREVIHRVDYVALG